MITLAQRKKMKKVFKNKYSKSVQELLNQKGVVSKKEKPFSISYISLVFNGYNENIEIEESIIKLYQDKLAEIKKISNKRKEIFNA